MVRNYVRKTERQQWNVSNMQRAIGAVKTGKMGFERAARSHNVIEFNAKMTKLT